MGELRNKQSRLAQRKTPGDGPGHSQENGTHNDLLLSLHAKNFYFFGFVLFKSNQNKILHFLSSDLRGGDQW